GHTDHSSLERVSGFRTFGDPASRRGRGPSTRGRLQQKYSSYVPLRQRNYAAGPTTKRGESPPSSSIPLLLRFGLARGANFACLGTLLSLRGFVLHLLALVQRLVA